MPHNALSDELLRQLFRFPKLGQKYRELMRFSPSEITLLAALAYRRNDRDPTITMSEISDLLEISRPAATQLVLRLCVKGYLERFHDERDRRVIRVRLAPQASHMVEDAIESLLTSADRVIADLGEEKSRQLIALQQEFSEAILESIACPLEGCGDPFFSNLRVHKEAIV